MHSPSAHTLSRPRPLTRLPSCIKTRNALQTGYISRKARTCHDSVTCTEITQSPLGVNYSCDLNFTTTTLRNTANYLRASFASTEQHGDNSIIRKKPGGFELVEPTSSMYCSGESILQPNSRPVSVTTCKYSTVALITSTHTTCSIYQRTHGRVRLLGVRYSL